MRGPRHGDPTAYCRRQETGFSCAGYSNWVMLMGDFEIAWRAWRGLGVKDRSRFMRMVRVHLAEEMARRRVRHGTDRAYRGRPSLAGLNLDGADLAEVDVGPPATSLEELTLDW